VNALRVETRAATGRAGRTVRRMVVARTGRARDMLSIDDMAF